MATEPRRVAFCGLGIMGGPMAANLVRAGFDLTVYTRTHEKAERFASEHGARAAESPREAADGADAVISMVPDAPEVEEVLLGEHGAVHGLAEGALAIDMSTIAPTAARAIGERLGDDGVAFLEAPVSGSRPKAEDGTLTIMAGGESADFDRARPLFEAMGERIVHVGPRGHAQLAKLLTNTMGAVHAVALAESVLAAERAGLDPEAFLEVAAGSAGNSTVLGLKGSPMFERDFTPLFKLEHMLKDVRHCLDEARALGRGAAAGLARGASLREGGRRRTRGRGLRRGDPGIGIAESHRISLETWVLVRKNERPASRPIVVAESRRGFFWRFLSSMPVALKEWAVTVRALAEGEQLITLRKGGIREENKHFEIEHDRFFLYPTFDHQRNDLVRQSHLPELARALEEGVWPDDEPPAKALLQDGGIPQPERVRIRAWAEVSASYLITDPRAIDALSPYYVWTTDYAEKRLRWKRRHPLHVMVLRTYRIPRPVTVKVRPEYRGCHSWLELYRDLPFEGTPVLSDEEFERASEQIEAIASDAVPVLA